MSKLKNQKRMTFTVFFLFEEHQSEIRGALIKSSPASLAIIRMWLSWEAEFK